MVQRLSSEDAAAALMCCTAKIYALLAAGKLRGVKVGRRWIISAKSIDDLLLEGWEEDVPEAR